VCAWPAGRQACGAALTLAHPCGCAQFKGQTVLIGCDDMDLFKGIELKLAALERVLDYHPEWRGRLVLVQVTNAPRCAVAAALCS
jgi:trehalose-6-phosphate synthase